MSQSPCAHLSSICQNRYIICSLNNWSFLTFPNFKSYVKWSDKISQLWILSAISSWIFHLIKCYQNKENFQISSKCCYCRSHVSIFSVQFYIHWRIIWCAYSLLTSQIRIRVGEYDFSSIQEPYPFVERGVGRKVVHPKYNFFTYEYDLALVQLESPLNFAPHIAPICLPASDDLLIGENATVTGWGRLSEGGTLPSILQEVRPGSCS
jgi:hypothetical protein